MHITHIALWTRDLEGAAHFWKRYFDADIGAPYHSRRRPGFVSRFASLPGSGGRIELMSGPWVGEPAQAEAGWDHVAIALRNKAAVDRLAARCAADGNLLSASRTTGDGFYEAVIAMPDGTRVEITGPQARKRWPLGTVFVGLR